MIHTTHSMLVSIIKFLVARCSECISEDQEYCDSEECIELRKILEDLGE